MSSSWTAPLKRNWQKGTPQTAAFLRTADGGTVAVCKDRSGPDEQQLVLWLVVGVSKMSEGLRARLKSEWDALKKRPEVPSDDTCSRCGGSGDDPDSPDCRCDCCGGTGKEH